MEDFKIRLSHLMHKKNYNNTTLANRLDLSAAAVKKWKDGKGMPALAIVDSLAEILGVTPAYLLYGVEEKPPQNILREPEPIYGIPKEDLIEFYKWKANEATKQVERLERIEIDTNKL